MMKLEGEILKRMPVKDTGHENAGRDESWRALLRGKTGPRERISIERVKMPEQEPLKRNRNFSEVNSGLTPEQAISESRRCLDCVTPTCISGCPVGIDIPRFIKYIETGNFIKSAQVIRETNALPAVCGRVCPQEAQCEASCFYSLKLKKEPVAIGHLERFVSDRERESGKGVKIPSVIPNNIKVAVIGSGPSGLAASGDLAKYGYDVTVFEALHEPGGVLKYGIPEFRLPRAVVDHEIECLRKLGVKFVKNFIVGKTADFNDLREEWFRAFFVGSGAGLPRFMNIPGENFIGISSSNEYLTRVNLMNAADPDYDTPVHFGKNVAVIGGGNTAMDAVRTARRLGAERAMIIYRRSIDEMPAREEEVRHAIEEGIEFICLKNPVRYLANPSGRVSGIVLQEMCPGEPDESGRRKPVPVNGSEKTLETDQVIVSVGVSPNPLIPRCIPELEITKWGTFRVNPETMQTNIPDIFAGGDIIRGGATVILAMGDGRKAAAGINEYLKNTLSP
jgi:glutamate synthase (NADPH/NADH) small chain